MLSYAASMRRKKQLKLSQPKIFMSFSLFTKSTIRITLWTTKTLLDMRYKFYSCFWQWMFSYLAKRTKRGPKNRNSRITARRWRRSKTKCIRGPWRMCGLLNSTSCGQFAQLHDQHILATAYQKKMGVFPGDNSKTISLHYLSYVFFHRISSKWV